MANTEKNNQDKHDTTEIRGAQTNAADAEKAPRRSKQQQATEQKIAEGSASATQGQAKQAPTGQPAEGAPRAEEDTTRKERDRTPLEKTDAKTVETQHEAAEAAGAKMLKVTVDGVDVEVPEGTLAIEACFRAGADVPYFCYHPRLTSVGACRMCLVNIELEMFGSRASRILTCCTVPVTDGMAIKTSTPDVKKAQNGMLEFLLANHPLDCPICDRGGECPLQNMTVAYGPPTSRFIEEKRHFPKAMPISDYVVLDRERCIQCMRCTRFCEEIGGDGQLGILNRGSNAEIGTFFGHDFSSNFSGNTIEICPVGALTSRTYRFAGRPWEIKSTDSICSKCGNGCNVAVQTRLGDLVRINGRTNEAVNEEWTCDRGKFGQYYVNDEKRLTAPLMKVDGAFREVSWDEALRAIAERIRAVKAESGPDAIAAVGSTRCTVEENYLLGKMIRSLVGTNNIAHQMSPYPFEPMQTGIADLETFKTIVSVGMKLDFDQPIVYLRVYKAVRTNGANWVQAPTLDASVEKALSAAGAGAVLLVPHTLGLAEIARARELCVRAGAKFNLLLPDCNSWGAPRAGASPDLLPGMKTFAEARAHVEKMWGAPLPTAPGRGGDNLFEACVGGAVRVLYVMGSDPAQNFHDPGLAKRALEAAEFVVVQELFLTETAQAADIVLPAASFAEKDGTFVNIEGREQKIRQALPPRGDSRPDWRILADLMARLGAPAPYFSARDIYREYSRAIPKTEALVTA